MPRRRPRYQKPASLTAAPADKGAVGGPARASAAFTRGVAALAQYLAREGAGKPVPRAHSEGIAVRGEAEPVSVRLGVFLSNTKARRDKLTDPRARRARGTGGGVGVVAERGLSLSGVSLGP